MYLVALFFRHRRLGAATRPRRAVSISHHCERCPRTIFALTVLCCSRRRVYEKQTERFLSVVRRIGQRLGRRENPIGNKIGQSAPSLVWQQTEWLIDLTRERKRRKRNRRKASTGKNGGGTGEHGETRLEVAGGSRAAAWGRFVGG